MITVFKNVEKFQKGNSAKKVLGCWYGMVARTQLAVLDFNPGSQRIQATAQENKNCFKVSFSKVTQNWVVKKNSSKENKKYIAGLMEEAIKMKSEKQNHKVMSLPSNVPKYTS